MTRPVRTGAVRWRAERRPSETDALLVEAHRHLERGQRDRARRVVKETLLTEMNLPEGLEVGRLLHLLDETQAAVDLFHTLLRQARESVDQATVRAALLMVLGRYDEALEPLRFLVDHRPDAAEAHLRLAQCLARSGDDDGSLAAIRRASQVAPPWPDIHLELGRLALRLGAVEEARVALYRAWRIDPDDRFDTLAIAGLWMRARRSDEALPLYEHALQQHPHAPDVLGEAGLAFAHAERIDEARRCLEQLIARHPSQIDTRRRLEAAIDEAAALDDSIVELDADDIVSIDGTLPPGDAEGTPLPAGFAGLLPVARSERRLPDVTTGEVEAALGTLDLDLSLDDFGSFDDSDRDDVPSSIPPPLGLAEDESVSMDDPSYAPTDAPPEVESAASEPPVQAPEVGARPTLLAPPPAAVPRPAVEPAGSGDSIERAFAALVVDDPLDTSTDDHSGSVVGPVSADPTARPGADDPGDDASAGGALDDSFDEPAERGLGAALALPGPADGDPGGSARNARLDEPPRLHADIPSARAGESLEDLPPARPPPSAFALLGPPPDKRRQTGPLPTSAALPPLMAFGSLSGDLSSSHLDAPDPPFESRRSPPPRRSRRSTGSMPLLAPRPSSAPPEHRPEPPRRPPAPPADRSAGSSGGHGSAERRATRHPTGGHRRFDAPPGSGPTGPLPSLPRRQSFAEMAVGQGLTHRGGAPAPATPAVNRSRRGDRPRPETSPGGPMPPPGVGGWGAAPRTDPLLSTSDALQRWRPPSPDDPSAASSSADSVRSPADSSASGRTPRQPNPSSAPPRPGEQRQGARSAPSLRSQTALIAGSQSVFWIPRILRFMEAGHLSGAVGLSSPRGQAEVQFRAGRLTGASASTHPTLAQVLQQPDRLRPEQRSLLGDLTWTAQDGESLLDRLVETGLFEAPNVNAAVIDQVFGTVNPLLDWNVGWFTLVAHADPPTPGGRMVKLPLAALLSGVEDDRGAGPAALGGHLRPAVEDSQIDSRLEARIRAQRQRVERSPEDDRARLQLGQLLMRAEHYVEAIDAFMTGLSGSVDQRFVKLIGLAIEGLAQHGPRQGSERRLPIALCGRLGRVGLVQLLEMLVQERVTGTVRLMAQEGLSEIDLAGGELVGATNSNTARLGDLMRASSIMTSDQIEALVARQYARQGWIPLGRLAVEAGLLEPDQMRGLLQKQVRLALLESGRWRQAHFVVELVDRADGLRLQRDLDTEGIVRDLRRMVGGVR